LLEDRAPVSTTTIARSRFEDGHEFRSVPLDPRRWHRRCIMIVTDHSSVDYSMIRRNAKLVVDTRNAMPKED
jgi:UDP-N-acetyl-D-mannosaminuronate dehydrogenase